jgi:SAM-dependent methyltransferase
MGTAPTLCDHPWPAVEGDLFMKMVALEERHWWFLGRGALVRMLVERECRARGGRVRRLVDVGTGTGWLLRRFVPFADEAVGVEPDDLPLGIARSRGLDVRQAPADALPFEDQSVDVITGIDVLEHLDDDVAAGREIRRVLRDGGTAVLTVPAYQWLWSDHDVLHHHRRRYTRGSLRRTLEASGLRVERSGYLMSLLLPIAVVERLAARLLRRQTADLAVPPRPLNALLVRIVLWERRAVLRGGFPFGLTVFAVVGRA